MAAPVTTPARPPSTALWKHATTDMEYFKANSPLCDWRIEKLPRGPLASAVLHAVMVSAGPI